MRGVALHREDDGPGEELGREAEEREHGLAGEVHREGAGAPREPCRPAASRPGAAASCRRRRRAREVAAVEGGHRPHQQLLRRRPPREDEVARGRPRCRLRAGAGRLEAEEAALPGEQLADELLHAPAHDRLERALREEAHLDEDVAEPPEAGAVVLAVESRHQVRLADEPLPQQPAGEGLPRGAARGVDDAAAAQDEDGVAVEAGEREPPARGADGRASAGAPTRSSVSRRPPKLIPSLRAAFAAARLPSWSASVAGGTGGPRWKPCASAQPSRSRRCELRRRLDALGADAQLEPARHRGDRGEERHVLRVRGGPAQEREVELHAVEGQLGEAAERGVADREAVEDERDAEGLQAVEHVERAREVGDDVALGHLELQAPRREAGLLERRLHLVGERAASSARAARGSRRAAARAGGAATRAPGAAAVRRIHGPIARMRPVKSDFERKLWGKTRPSCGCCQRRSASTPTIVPVPAA